MLINHGEEPFIISKNMRIAQLVVAPYVQVQWEIKETLDDTQRGEKGFGSTGM